MRQMKKLLVSLGVLAGVSLLAGNAEAATKYVKIGHSNHNFVKTQRQLKVNGTAKKVSYTIPKGTIVEATQDNIPNNKRKYVRLDMSRLSYRLRGNQRDYGTKRILATTKTFKKVHVPKYVQYYTTQLTYPSHIGRNRVADGNLYAGLKIPDNLDYTKSNLTQRLYVTADGYLEYYEKAPMLSPTVKQVPTVSAKITQVERKSGSSLTKLYTKKAVPTAIADRISKTGSQQYVTIINRRYRVSATVSYVKQATTNVGSIDMATQYQVKKHNFFMASDVVFPEE